MKKASIITLSTLFILFGGHVGAEELPFPQTEQEIVAALSIRDGRTVYEGVEYISENGKVYKIIAGKRYRMRGLKIISDSDIVPKAGALINFDFDSSSIRPESHALLDEFGKALKGGLPDVTVMIVGYTDSQGSESYNQKLSEARAQAVADYLNTRHGVSKSRLLVKGAGEFNPIASNDSEQGRSKNRRVEFIRAD